MKYIESTQNPRYKAIRQLVGLASGKLRQSGYAVCEGIHLVEALVANCPGAIHQVWVSQAHQANHEVHAILRALPGDTECYEIPEFMYEKLSLLKSPQSPLAVFTPPKEDFAQDRGDILILDGVQDPNNVGALLRTACAAGIEQVLTIEGTAWPWSDKALRAGMGAQTRMRFQSEISIADAAKRLMGKRICITHLSKRSVDLYELDLTMPTAWVVGNEGAGVSSNWLDFADHLVRIPQNDSVESLNVAASCAIVLFEQRRQRIGK